MYISTSHTKRTNTGDPDTVCIPILQTVIYVKRTLFKMNMRIGFFKVNRGRNFFMIKCQGSLDETGDSGRCCTMSDI